MTDSVYVNADRTQVVDENDPKAAYKIHLKEAKRLGLLKEAPKGTKVVEPSLNGDGPKRTRKTTDK